MEIFVSYAWVDEKPDINVLNLVAVLRENGYDAVCDVMLRQEETSIHFTKMMAVSLRAAEKVIVVLSENYKRKADSFRGGVGDEYQYLIEDIKTKTNKYILCTFEPDRDKVTPDFLRGRDILYLNKSTILCDELLHKIGGTESMDLGPVNPQKTKPRTTVIRGECDSSLIEPKASFQVSGNQAKNMLVSQNATIKGGVHFG